MNKKKIILNSTFWLTLLLVLLTAITTFGQVSGSLDPTFNQNGKVVTTVISSDKANAAIRGSDGKLIIVGEAQTQQAVGFGVIKMNRDGSLDTTFGINGQVVTQIGTLSRANAVAVQPDGKIVVAGISGSGFDGNFAVARYNSNGLPLTVQLIIHSAPTVKSSVLCRALPIRLPFNPTAKSCSEEP